jgi:hypothetical protein
MPLLAIFSIFWGQKDAYKKGKLMNLTFFPIYLKTYAKTFGVIRNQKIGKFS